jgi:hypothetical protein
MKWKGIFLLFLVSTGLLLVSGSSYLRAKDNNEVRDRIRSARAGAREILTLAQASVRLDVKPKDAQVFVDNRLSGVVRDFNGKNDRLFIFPGRHTIELRHPDYEPYRVDVDLLPEQDMRIKFRMRKLK